MDESRYNSLDNLSLSNNMLVRMRDAQWIKGESDLKLEQQFSGTYTMIVVNSGSGHLILDHRRYQLRSEVAFVCAPKQTFGVMASNEGLDIYIFRFDLFQEMKRSRNKMKTVDNVMLFGEKGEVSIYPAGKLSILCRAVYEKWIGDEELKYFRSQIDFQELLYFIAENSRKLASNSITGLERTREYMEEHYQEPITIETLANIAAISPKYYVDLFKKSYGISAMGFLTEIRIRHAKRLLLQKGGRMKDIAEQVGYQDEFYFSRKFKKEVGVSPTDYMKSRVRKVAAYGHAAIGHLLSLNIIPYIATLHPKWTKYYYERHRADIPIHLSAYLRNVDWEENVDKLVKSRPDLVIATGKMFKKERELIEQGVPMFYSPAEEDGWRQQFLSVAEFLGETEEAERCLGEYEREVKEARSKLEPYDDEKVLVLRMLRQNMYAHCNKSIAEVLYGDLKRNPWDMEAQTSNLSMTIEDIAAAEVDRILVLICQETETLAFWKSLQTNTEWQQIAAVRKRKVHQIYSDTWREYSLNAHRRAIADILKIYSGENP